MEQGSASFKTAMKKVVQGRSATNWKRGGALAALDGFEVQFVFLKILTHDTRKSPL